MPDSTVPIERILTPIAPGTRKDYDYSPDGSGRDYSFDYEEIEEARRVVEDSPTRGDEFDKTRQQSRRNPKPAQWDKVLAIGVKVLISESKDLLVAAWVVEALGHLRGFAGLRDGFTLFRKLQGRYWDSSYPKSDGDPAARLLPYEFLDNRRNLPLLIQGIPLTFPDGGTPLSLLRRKEAERNEKEASGPEGRLMLKDWQASIGMTSAQSLGRNSGEIAACLLAFKAWEKATDRLCRDLKPQPSLTQIGNALLECAGQVEEMFPDRDHRDARALALAIRRFEGERRPPAEVKPSLDYWLDPTHDVHPSPAPEPRPSPEPRPAPEPEVVPAQIRGEAVHEDRAPVDVEPEKAPENAESAYRQVREAAEFLRWEDPDDPVPYLLIRSLQLGSLFGRRAEEHQPSPAREIRKELRQMAADGAWDQVVKLTEDVLSKPEGRGWLDAHRLSIRGLEESGLDRAAGACRGLLAAVLGQAPGLPDAELDDGTASASAETRVWIAEMLEANRRRSMGHVAEPEAKPEAELPPVEAETLLRDGRTEEAIDAFSASLEAAPGDRARYLATVRFAEACLESGLEQLALPILEGLGSQADERMLRAWEGRGFFVGAAAMLHETLLRGGNDESSDRFARSHARLALLAPALGLGRNSR